MTLLVSRKINEQSIFNNVSMTFIGPLIATALLVFQVKLSGIHCTVFLSRTRDTVAPQPPSKKVNGNGDVCLFTVTCMIRKNLDWIQI